VISPEARHIQNSLRLARETEKIGVRAEKVLRTAARNAMRKINVTGGEMTRVALEAQLSQIQSVFQEAGIASYDQFVDDVAGDLATWTRRDAAEVRATVASAVEQGDLAQEALQAGPAAGIGPGVGGQALISEQALRVVSTMGPIELAVAGSAKQPYSLGREFANAFLTPDNRSLQQDFKAQAIRLNEVFEREIRGGVLSGATNADIIRQLKGEGALVGKMNAPISQLKTLALTGAQSTANAVQTDQLNQNTAVEFVRYLATLDQRTSPICRQLDGEVFKKEDAPRPPLHFRCRSVLVAHIPGRDAGGRSMTMAVKEGDKVKFVGAYDPKYQNSFTTEQKALIAKNKSGKPPTYADWLKAQPAAGQDAILGGKNGRTYRNTGSLTKAQSKATKQAKAALPKPLKASQLKQKLKKAPAAPANAVKPKAKPKVKAPPVKVAAPAGSAGQVVDVPKPAPKPAPKKAAPKPKAATPKPAPKPKATPVKKAAAKPTPKPAPAPKPAPVQGVDAEAEFNAAGPADVLGAGAYGEARRTASGVTKRGRISKTEIPALELMNDSGVTPEFKGVKWIEKDFQKTSIDETREGFMTMGLAPGKSVAFWREAEPKVSVRRAQFQGTMQARKKMHKAGIAHNDMHSGNVMFDEATGKTTLIDFGMADIHPVSALVEAMETDTSFTSEFLFRAIWGNQRKLIDSEPMWIRFKKNKAAVSAAMEKDGYGDFVGMMSMAVDEAEKAAMPIAKAKQYMDQLYEGI